MAEQNIAEMVTSGYPTALQGEGSDAAHFQAAVQLWRQYGDKVPLPVIGHSMLPLLRAGDRLTVLAQSSYHIGEIVLFAHAEALIVHRIVAKAAASPPTWITQGDNCALPDAPIAQSAILGRAIARRRGEHLYCLDTVGRRIADQLIVLIMQTPWCRPLRRRLLRLLTL